MKTEALIWIALAFIAIVVLAAIGLHVSGTPVSDVATVAAAITGAVGALTVALVGRTQVLSQDTATKVVAEALERPTPANPEACAKEMVKKA